MTLSDIARTRLINHQIVQPKWNTPSEVVGWMGAMQAQDFEMSKWAIGVRQPNLEIKDVQDAVNKGEIIRTHLLRPTWHLVASEDVGWMLDLCAHRIKASLKSRWKELELNTKELHKCYRLIEQNMAGDKHLTRDELKGLFSAAGIVTANNRLSHILMGAEMEKLICSGINKNKKPTYALFGERVKDGKTMEKDEAISALASRYFSSHGPATVEDFMWWSGLPLTQARKAVEIANSKLERIEVEQVSYWFNGDYLKIEGPVSQIHLLPAFDEFVISYKDRTAIIASDHQKKAFSANGMFFPIIVYDGKVIGIWKRKIHSSSFNVSFEFFTNLTNEQRQFLNSALRHFERFSQMKFFSDQNHETLKGNE